MPAPEQEAAKGGCGIGHPIATEELSLTEEDHRRCAEALETLPLLTRAVFLLNCCDDFSYDKIGWRCGISVDEVQVRMADALIDIGRYMRGRLTIAGRTRWALLPWRDAWAAARAREGDRRLAPWLSPERRPGRRGMLEWIAWAFEMTMRKL